MLEVTFSQTSCKLHSLVQRLHRIQHTQVEIQSSGHFENIDCIGWMVTTHDQSVEVMHEIMFSGMYVDAHTEPSPLCSPPHPYSSQDVWQHV